MYQQTQQILSQLVVLLKEHKLWQSEPIEPAALQSTVPFCHDTMAFEQWLQFVFIPKMQHIIATKQPLPSNFAIAPMAELMLEQQPGGAEITTLLTKLDNSLANNNE